MTLPAAEVIYRQMVGWLVNNELERTWQEAMVDKFTIPVTRLEGMRKTINTQDSRCPDRYSN
jgi:hypothetical protein